MTYYLLLLVTLATLATAALITYIFMHICIYSTFWAKQPVCHVYDFYYIFFYRGIINKYLPQKNKYTNIINISTITFSESTEFINLIQQHYLNNGENTFTPLAENITPYLSSHNQPCYLSLYHKKTISSDLQSNILTVGSITSRPVAVHISSLNSLLYAYYVDYLCVDTKWRKTGIASQLIQTHHYNQSHMNKQIQISIFKREEELTGIMPICTYNTYGYPIKQLLRIPLVPLHNKVVQLVTDKNYYEVALFIEQAIKNKTFELSIIVSTANILGLIKTGNVFIYTLLNDAVYFFRKSCTYVSNNVEVLSCFASICACTCTDELFMAGYMNAIIQTKFKYIAIERISHNFKLLNQITSVPNIISPTAYFFYNYVYPTVSSDKVIVIN